MNLYFIKNKNTIPNIFTGMVILGFIYFGIIIIPVRPIWIDEIFTFYHSNGGSWNDFINQTYCGLHRMPPLYFIITKFLFNGDDFINSCRYLSLMCSCFTVIYLY